MPLSFAVVCEARADRDTACGLADRILCDGVSWISADTLNNFRQWRGQELYEPFLTWRGVADRAHAANIKAHGFFDGRPGAPDAHAARLALLLLHHAKQPPDGILLVRDDDRQTERRRGLEQARAASTIRVPVVIALAHVNRECWVLAGFDPASPEEQQVFDQLRKQLGFDPRSNADRLTAKHHNDLRSARRVLTALVGPRAEREAQCWQAASIDDLQSRGQNTGLATFLQEVWDRLLPLFK